MSAQPYYPQQGYPQYTQPTTGAARDLGVRDTGRTVQQVTGTRMVPVNQTVMEAQTVQQPRTYIETHHPKIEMEQKTIQVPKTVMEDQEIQVNVPRTIMESHTRYVPRTVLVPVEVEVPRVIQVNVPRTIME